MRGHLIKTHEKSWFKSFNIYSPFAKQIFNEDSNMVILQIMSDNNENAIAEVVYKNDYVVKK